MKILSIKVKPAATTSLLKFREGATVPCRIANVLKSIAEYFKPAHQSLEE